MIERAHQNQDQTSRAWYSSCEAYRYGLERRWSDGPSLLYVMLNPSTATEERNDPTIERCQRRAVALGFGALRIANLFAFRATKPQDLRKAKDPVGSDNDALLMDWAEQSDMTLAAWGVHGALLDRAAELAPRLPGDVRHLGLTRDGHPRHPLYVSYDTQPQAWPREARYP
ncbi:DUF1643 domain-containing protein [Thalassococcus lentus]|uniref:DUF1643 domain-containing protein n=1 Tax=Thalassococcus lentus TaxID=1210524 RepID=A0ABT4XUY6_9RHOB|nr:DUF1643 domain-containing protein [Thalassococcus lentus]MDA7425783.1 DUF1643 domain-containing protein [Thalassococcus lentus]